eukprot:1193475-Prorocentrum_minimum.AAC.4
MHGILSSDIGFISSTFPVNPEPSSGKTCTRTARCGVTKVSRLRVPRCVRCDESVTPLCSACSGLRPQLPWGGVRAPQPPRPY